MQYIIIWGLKFSSKWNSLTRYERKKLQNEEIPSLVESYSQKITLRTADSEAFSNRFQDFIIIETTNINDYYRFYQDIRDTKIVRNGYFEIVDTFMGIENAHELLETNDAQ